MSVERDLNLLVARRGERLVTAATRQYRTEVMRDRSTPEDAGTLKLGFRLGPVQRRGTVVQAEFSSAAKNRGFDYPEFIDKAIRIVPTKRKFLRWQGRDGGYVFSRGFVNRHRGWWKKTVTQKRWSDALRQSLVFR